MKYMGHLWVCFYWLFCLWLHLRLWSITFSLIFYCITDRIYNTWCSLTLPATTFQKQTEMLITSSQFHLDQSQMTLFINCSLLLVSREWNLSWNTTSFPFCAVRQSEALFLQISSRTPPILSYHKKKKVLQEKTSRRWKLVPCWRLLHVPICQTHSTQQLKATGASLFPQVIYQFWQANFLFIPRFAKFSSSLGRGDVEEELSISPLWDCLFLLWNWNF